MNKNHIQQTLIPAKEAARLTEEGKQIIVAIEEVKEQLHRTRQKFDMTTNETLMDCYIYEIIALTKKYEFFLKAAKELGLVAEGFEKIG